MIEYVLDALGQAGVPRVIVVVGYRADLVRQTFANRAGVEFVEQLPQLGTGHAVMMCRSAARDHQGSILILTGDSPLVQPKTLKAMLAEFDRVHPAALMGTARKENPAGLGRVVRDSQGNFLAIVEEKDATPQQKAVHEVNMSYYLFNAHELWHALDRVQNDNAQGEYYITDAPGILKAEGKDVRALCVLAPCETLSVNTADELSEVEMELASRKR
jgi:bifunctional UDP-N-acetylglucosamine pyrophosphorylase/glucosamine-1-phosphate N-acetyltransferase/UDP-N-acetylglucosamine pyrophosphorylase